MKPLILACLLFAAPAAAQDAFDLSSATLTGGADVRAWPATTTITALATGPQGLDIQFDKRQTQDWPDVIPAGWTGPVYYTVWLGTRLADGVHLAASLNVYRGQAPGSGAGDVTDVGQYSRNLWYLEAALKAHVTQEGETLYLMVTAGGLRGASAIGVQERSNVVSFTASSAPRTFTYAAEPPPVVTPPTVPPPAAPPPVDLTPRIAALEARVAQLEQQHTAIDARVLALEAKTIYTQCRASVLGIAVSCRLQ